MLCRRRIFQLDLGLKLITTLPPPGVQKTGIRGIFDGKTNDIENNDKKGGSKVQTLNIRQFMKKAI